VLRPIIEKGYQRPIGPVGASATPAVGPNPAAAQSAAQAARAAGAARFAGADGIAAAADEVEAAGR
jgi:hypothetical protein